MGKTACSRKIVDYVCRSQEITSKELFAKSRAQRIIAAQRIAYKLLSRFKCQTTNVYRRLSRRLPMLFISIGPNFCGRTRPHLMAEQLDIKLRATVGIGLEDYLNYDVENEKMTLEEFIDCSRVLSDPEFRLRRSDIIYAKDGDNAREAATQKPTEVHFVCNSYEIACGATGAVDVVIDPRRCKP